MGGNVTKIVYICNKKREVNMVNSIHNQVERRVKSKRKGSVFFADDFKAIGSPDAVKMALSRLAKEGIVVRVAQGIYLYPKVDPEMGRLSASIESIAAAIAKRDRARILPTGVLAMQMLGFSTQVPMKSVFLTNGSPRKIQLGRRTITFKRTSAKHLAMKGKVTTLVVLGLQELGQSSVTHEIKSLVASALRRETKAILEHDMLLAPVWIAQIMREAIQQNNN